ncbi:MAG: glucose 1-dehydrogenase [Anaerolineales bacterium]|nr:glucose 1-dehydrogenase [Anaerolineales bacterium]
MQLENKVAIITGAASGMGKAMAKGYAKEGASVVIADLDADAATAVAESINSDGGHAIAIKYDVTDIQQSRDLVDSTLDKYGQLDILVNNAGVVVVSPIEDVTPEDWDLIFDVNAKGLFFLSQIACVPMRKQSSGKIINMASGAGRTGGADAAAYSASKATVMSITRCFAMAMGAYNVNVNGIAPGIVRTPFWDKLDDEFVKIGDKSPGDTWRELSKLVVLGRPGVAEDVVPMAIFLAGSGSDYITGQTYNVEGGIVMS